MKLIAKGSSDARLIIAEKTMESLRVVSKAMEGICADPTQYLIGLQYIKMLKYICHYKQILELQQVECDVFVEESLTTLLSRRQSFCD